MDIFKLVVAERVFNYRSNTANSFGSFHDRKQFDYSKIRIFNFSGLEIFDDEDLNMLENNSYLFASKGNSNISLKLWFRREL